LIIIKRGIIDSQIIGVTPELKRKLRQSLSYINESEKIARFVMKKTKGYIPSWMPDPLHILIDDDNIFPSGLYDRAMAILKNANEEIIIDDKIIIPEATPLTLKQELNLWNHQEEAMEAIKREKNGMIRIGTGGGKAIPIDSLVLTINGYKLMKDISLNDEVITPDGKSKIIGIFPQGLRDVYKVIFSDGSFAESTLDHLWAVRSAKDKYYKKDFKIKSLEEILDMSLTRKNTENAAQHFIPITNPIDSFQKNELLPIHPYLLGVLIGDGSLHNNLSITTVDQEIIENITNCLPNDMKIVNYKNSISYGISNINPNGQKENLIRTFIKNIGLNVKSENKFIPDMYKFSSLNDRIELLQGLLDTDGGVESKRKISFSTSSKKLAEDIQFLVQSLGGITKINPRKTTHLISYRLNICLPNHIQPFKLQRKLNLVKLRTKYFPRRSIKSVEYVGKKEVQCIKIEDSKGLFLINDCVVTHNTKMSLKACAEIGQLPYLFVVNRISLLKQTHDDYEKYHDEPIGWIGDGTIDVKRINIATIGTICSILKIKEEGEEEENLNYTPEQIKDLKELLKNCKFLVVDECHHGSTMTYTKMIKAMPNVVYKIGLSATPMSTTGADILLEAAFGKIIYTKTASELIREDMLCQPEIYFVEYKDPNMTRAFPKNAKRGVHTKIYKACVVENELFNTMVAKLALVNAEMGRLTLISVKQIKHGKAIYDILKKISPEINFELLHGQNKRKLDEEKIKEDFASGKIKILISTLFDEGVDIKEVVSIIDAGGGKGAIKALQLVGRAIRKHPGKKKAYVFMFVQPYQQLHKHSQARAQILSTEEAFKLQILDWDNG